MRSTQAKHSSTVRWTLRPRWRPVSSNAPSVPPAWPGDPDGAHWFVPRATAGTGDSRRCRAWWSPCVPGRPRPSLSPPIRWQRHPDRYPFIHSQRIDLNGIGIGHNGTLKYRAEPATDVTVAATHRQCVTVVSVSSRCVGNSANAAATEVSPSATTPPARFKNASIAASTRGAPSSSVETAESCTRT